MEALKKVTFLTHHNSMQLLKVSCFREIKVSVSRKHTQTCTIFQETRRTHIFIRELRKHTYLTKPRNQYVQETRKNPILFCKFNLEKFMMI